MSTAAVELKRRGRPKHGEGTPANHNESSFLRTTIVLPETVDSNVTLLCAQKGISKSEYIRRLVCADLLEHDFQPDKKPRKISVLY
jgi:hypothetical protein